jgi:thiamine-monophosphate kinase
LGVALRGVANACIDVSDGLVGDLNHILQRSQVGAVLTTDWVNQSAAISKDMQELSYSNRLDYVLGGGDDYELVFTARQTAREDVVSASEQSNTKVTLIGQITKERGLKVLDSDGELITRRFLSFDHFQRSN